jgi:cathepsin F
MAALRSFLLLALVVSCLSASAWASLEGKETGHAHQNKEETAENHALSIGARFSRWMQRFSVKYTSPEEEKHRLKVFAKNSETAHALDLADPHASYGENVFSDRTPAEFRRTHLNYVRPNNNTTASRPLLLNETQRASLRASAQRFAKGVGVPTDFDWRNRGAVTPVYNQGQCGSCWAFSTTENVESMWALAGHGLHNLAMQELVDCSHNGNHGCGGGNPPYAYEWLLQSGGFMPLRDYPYTGENGACRFQRSEVVAEISKWGFVTERDNENEMGAFTYEHGPPSICVDASRWQYYTGGVITRNCGRELDHCVQITGFSTQNGIPAWNVRNSWGTAWGESGYLYVARGDDVCGIGQEVTSSLCA